MLEESSDSDSDEENISELLKIHRQIQVFREQVHADPTLTKYMYYRYNKVEVKVYSKYMFCLSLLFYLLISKNFFYFSLIFM